MQKTGGSFSNSQLADIQRSRLDVNLGLILAVALIITGIVYLALLPWRTFFIRVLLYERGITQPLVVWLANIVIVFTVMKWRKIRKEFQYFRKIWLPDTVKFNNHKAQELVIFQKNLAREGNLLALRCSRIIAAYIQSGSRQTAAEFAVDDSSFYLSNSESSYAFPRILVWAIPLLGFIGTVVGISQAVNGFSGFLEKAGEIEQIREGIGTVTSGLAVAFDTTLLALFLSVLVMIPLVVIERQESRLLLRIEMYINDYLLPRFKETNNTLDESLINQTVNTAIKNHLPSPEELIAPAHQYAQQAVKSLTDILMTEFLKFQNINNSLIDKIGAINQLALQDRNLFNQAVESQQKLNQNLLKNIDSLVNNIQLNYTNLSEQQKKSNQDLLNQVNNLLDILKINYTELSTGINQQTEQITEQLSQLAIILDNRINSLEIATANFKDIAQLKQSINDMILSLEKVAKIEASITKVLLQIQKLQPSLDKLSKPRIVTFLEQDE